MTAILLGQNHRRRDMAPINYITFNQDCTRFAIGALLAFAVYTVDPYVEIVYQEFGHTASGIGIVEMYYESPVVALVGAGGDPGFPSNKVVLFETKDATAVGEVSLGSDIRAVRLRKDTVVVAVDGKIHIYNIATLDVRHTFETVSDTKGLLTVTSDPANFLLVFQCVPGSAITAKRPHAVPEGKGVLVVQRVDPPETSHVEAHESSVAVAALSPDATRIATASEKGTIIRVFDLPEGKAVREFRRGSDRAAIGSLAFSHDGRFLAVCSDKGTLHVFAIDAAAAAGNRKSVLSALSGFISYTSSEWSFAWHHDIHVSKGPSLSGICGFSKDGRNIFLVRPTGELVVLAFNAAKGGELAASIPFRDPPLAPRR